MGHFLYDFKCTNYWGVLIIWKITGLQYRKMENFRVIQFSQNFAVGKDPQKLKIRKNIFQVCLK